MPSKKLNNKGYLLPSVMVFIILIVMLLISFNQISRFKYIENKALTEGYQLLTMVDMAYDYISNHHVEEDLPLLIHFNIGHVSVKQVKEGTAFYAHLHNGRNLRRTFVQSFSNRDNNEEKNQHNEEKNKDTQSIEEIGESPISNNIEFDNLDVFPHPPSTSFSALDE